MLRKENWKAKWSYGHWGNTELSYLVWIALLYATYVTEINDYLVKSNYLFIQPNVILIDVVTAYIYWFTIEEITIKNMWNEA